MTGSQKEETGPGPEAAALGHGQAQAEGERQPREHAEGKPRQAGRGAARGTDDAAHGSAAAAGRAVGGGPRSITPTTQLVLTRRHWTVSVGGDRRRVCGCGHTGAAEGGAPGAGGTTRVAGGIAAAGKAALGRGVRTQGTEATQMNQTWLNLKF